MGERCCGACLHFRDDPAEMEANFPGLAVMSSGWASVRADDGLCLRHGRLTNRRGGCGEFAARIGS
jgi:hypothetical protein